MDAATLSRIPRLERAEVVEGHLLSPFVSGSYQGRAVELSPPLGPDADRWHWQVAGEYGERVELEFVLCRLPYALHQWALDLVDAQRLACLAAARRELEQVGEDGWGVDLAWRYLRASDSLGRQLLDGRHLSGWIHDVDPQLRPPAAAPSAAAS